MKSLYGKDSKGELRVWSIFTEGSFVVVKHGKLNGKIQEKRYTAKGKNKGKANETSDHQQAVLEAEAKYTKQLKSGYFVDKEEALNFQEFTPMKAQNYNEFSHKIVYPCIGQPKLDGQRLMVDKEGNAWSKQGEPLDLPSHWINVKKLAIEQGGLDGEVYAGLKDKEGLSLQKIISAFRKPNQDTLKLKYYVYDIPCSDTALTRLEKIEFLSYNQYPDVVFVEDCLIRCPEDGDEYFKSKTEEGYEGVVYRNLSAEYEFGKRSYNLIKRKTRETTEALVIDTEIDRNAWGILTCRLENGVEFKCQMKVQPERNYRLYQNSMELIGEVIEVEYEAKSDDGVPQKPVGIGVRKVNKYFQPIL